MIRKDILVSQNLISTASAETITAEKLKCVHLFDEVGLSGSDISGTRSTTYSFKYDYVDDTDNNVSFILDINVSSATQFSFYTYFVASDDVEYKCCQSVNQSNKPVLGVEIFKLANERGCFSRMSACSGSLVSIDNSTEFQVLSFKNGEKWHYIFRDWTGSSPNDVSVDYGNSTVVLRNATIRPVVPSLASNSYIIFIPHTDSNIGQWGEGIYDAPFLPVVSNVYIWSFKYKDKHYTKVQIGGNDGNTLILETEED